MGKTSIVMAGITSTALMLGLTGCSSNSDSTIDTNTSPNYDSYSSSNYDSDTNSSNDSNTSPNYDSNNNSDIDSDTSLNDSIQSEDLPPVPEDSNCTDWEWDQDDGVWQCADNSSSYYGHSFYGGHYYSSKSALYNSKDYSSYKNSPSFKGGISTSGGASSESVTRSSGFGSGSKSFGG